MYEHINERISVVAIFGNTYNDVRPFKIKWHEREYLITKVSYVHKYKEGKTLYHAFSATDGVNYFELLFDPQELSWLIGRVSNNEAN